MKLLITFALIAVAFADEIRVVPLPPLPILSRVSMGQVIVPNYIIDAVKIGLPVMREAVLDDDEGLKVRFVDAPLEMSVDAPEPVMLGEAPLPAFEIADVAAAYAPDTVVVVDDIAEEIAPEPVQIAEAPLPAFETAEVDSVRFAYAPLDVAPVAEIAVESVKIAEPTLPELAEAIAPEPVQIAEAPLPAFETAEVDAVRFADAPLDVVAPEPVMLPEAVLPAFEAAEASVPIDAVKVAVPQYHDYRVKQFEDPRLR